jgi:hypothetical protein
VPHGCMQRQHVNQVAGPARLQAAAGAYYHPHMPVHATTTAGAAWSTVPHPPTCQPGSSRVMQGSAGRQGPAWQPPPAVVQHKQLPEILPFFEVHQRFGQLPCHPGQDKLRSSIISLIQANTLIIVPSQGGLLPGAFIHSCSEAGLFTKEHGARASLAQVKATCAACGKQVPTGFRAVGAQASQVGPGALSVLQYKAGGEWKDALGFKWVCKCCATGS